MLSINTNASSLYRATQSVSNVQPMERLSSGQKLSSINRMPDQGVTATLSDAAMAASKEYQGKVANYARLTHTLNGAADNASRLSAFDNASRTNLDQIEDTYVQSRQLSWFAQGFNELTNANNVLPENNDLSTFLTNNTENLKTVGLSIDDKGVMSFNSDVLTEANTNNSSGVGTALQSIADGTLTIKKGAIALYQQATTAIQGNLTTESSGLRLLA